MSDWSNHCFYEDQTRLREFLASIKERYDVILVDTPPNLHMATYSSLAAADHYIVPLVPEDFGSQGLAAVRQNTTLVKRKSTPASASSASYSHFMPAGEPSTNSTKNACGWVHQRRCLSTPCPSPLISSKP